MYLEILVLLLGLPTVRAKVQKVRNFIHTHDLHKVQDLIHPIRPLNPKCRISLNLLSSSLQLQVKKKNK